MKKLFILILSFVSFSLGAQISSNPTTFNNGIVTPKAIFPSYTTAERDAISPSATDRTIIHHKDTGIDQFEQWDGDSWEILGGLLQEVSNPMHSIYGSKLQALNASDGFYTVSTANKYIGHLINISGATGTNAYGGVFIENNATPFIDETVLIHYGTNYTETYLQNTGGLYTSGGLTITAAKNTSYIDFYLGNTATADNPLSGLDNVFSLKANREITFPQLTNTIIDNESTGQVPITRNHLYSKNYLQNVVEDITPQLGGELDPNGYSILSGNNSGTWNIGASLGLSTIQFNSIGGSNWVRVNSTNGLFVDNSLTILEGNLYGGKFNISNLTVDRDWEMPNEDGSFIVDAPADGNEYIRKDNMWSVATAAAGDVSSTLNITDNAIVRGDGGSKNVQDSGILIDDSDNVTGVSNLTANTYNGVALTDAGALTDFLNATGSYSSPIIDDIYGAGWNGDNDNGASRNAIYDKIESIIAGSGATASTETKSDWDGVADTWVVTVAPAVGHQIYEGSAYLVEGTHYTISGSTITFINPPTASVTTTYYPNVVVPVGIDTSDDLTEGSTNLYYTEARVSANSSVTANTAKITNATHTGEVTGSGVLTVDPTAVSNKTLKSSLSGAEEVLINDAGTLKKTTAQDIADLGGGSSAAVPVIQGNWYMGTGISRYYYTHLPVYDSAASTFYQTSSTNLPIFSTNTTSGYGITEDKTITSIKGVVTGTSEYNVNIFIISKHQEFISADLDITTATTTLTSTTHTFVAGDVGKDIIIVGAGTSGGNLVTTIASFTNANEVELTDSASTTVSGANGSLETNTELYDSGAISVKAYAPTVIDLTGLSFNLTAGDRVFIVNQSTVSVRTLELSLKLYE